MAKTEKVQQGKLTRGHPMMFTDQRKLKPPTKKRQKKDQKIAKMSQKEPKNLANQPVGKGICWHNMPAS